MIKTAVFIFCFVFLIGSPKNSSAQNIDIDILHELNQGGTIFRDNTCLFFTKSVTPVTVGVPLGAFIYGAIKKDSAIKRNSYVIAASLFTSTVITVGMKYAINRDRPFVTYHFITKKTDGGSPSFPSGHTSSAFSTATSLSLCYPKWYIIAPSFLWASAVGYSRMELGVHYPSDVLAGAIVGAGSSWLMWKANKWYSEKQKRKAIEKIPAQI